MSIHCSIVWIIEDFYVARGGAGGYWLLWFKALPSHWHQPGHVFFTLCGGLVHSWFQPSGSLKQTLLLLLMEPLGEGSHFLCEGPMVNPGKEHPTRGVPSRGKSHIRGNKWEGVPPEQTGLLVRTRPSYLSGSGAAVVVAVS